MANNNEWVEKYKRENWTMPFGSLLNAYAQMHQQKPVALKRFKEDAAELFDLAEELTLKSLTFEKGKTLEALKSWVREIGEGKESDYGKQAKQESYNEKSQLDDINRELASTEEKEEVLPVIEEK